MPNPRKNLNYGGNRVVPGDEAKYVKGAFAQPVKRRNDPNINRPGYALCETCGYWIRQRKDGTLMSHATDGRKQLRSGVPCLASNPRDGD